MATKQEILKKVEHSKKEVKVPTDSAIASNVSASPILASAPTGKQGPSPAMMESVDVAERKSKKQRKNDRLTNNKIGSQS